MENLDQVDISLDTLSSRATREFSIISLLVYNSSSSSSPSFISKSKASFVAGCNRSGKSSPWHLFPARDLITVVTMIADFLVLVSILKQSC